MAHQPPLLGSSLIFKNKQLLLLGGSKVEDKDVIVNEDVYSLQLNKELKRVNWDLDKSNRVDIGSSKLVQFGKDSFVSLSTGIETINLNIKLEPDEDKSLEQGAWTLYVMDKNTSKFNLKETQDTPPLLTGYSICNVPNSKFGTLIVYGGFNLETNQLNNEMYSFDLGTKDWKKLKFNKVTPYRYLHNVVCEDKFMYVIGGTNLTHTTGLGWVDIFDFDKLSWDSENLKGLPPKPRFLSSIVKIRNEVVFLGGVDSQNEIYNDIFRLDLKKFSWIQQSNNDKKLAKQLGYSFGSAVTLINDTTLVFKLGWNKLNANSRRGLQRREDGNDFDTKTFFLDVESRRWSLLDFQTISDRFPELVKLPNDDLKPILPPPKPTEVSNDSISTVTLICSIVFSTLILLLLIVIILYFVRKKYNTNKKQAASGQPLMQRSATPMQFLDTIHEVDEVSYTTEPTPVQNNGFRTNESEVYPNSLMQPVDEDYLEESIRIGQLPLPSTINGSTVDLAYRVEFQDPIYSEQLFDPEEIINENSVYNTGVSLPSTPGHSKILNLKATSTVRKLNYDTNVSDDDISILDAHHTQMSINHN